MLFLKSRENIWGEEEIYDVCYVDGAFITACNIFLLFGCVMAVCLPIFGLADWICKNIILCAVIYSVLIVLILIFQTRKCRKAYMLCFAFSTAISLITPALAMALSAIPYTAFLPGFDSILGLIFFGLLYCGGAFLTVKINVLLKNGISCLVVSVLYALLSGVITILFYTILEGTFTVQDMMSLYSG